MGIVIGTGTETGIVIGTGIGIGTGTGIGIVIEGGDRGQDHVTVIAESISIVQDQEIGIEIGDVHAQEIEDEADLEVEAETNIVQRATNHKRWITTAQTMSQMVMEQFPGQWKLI